MEKTYEIHNLGCAHCGSKIEEAINKLEGVDSAVLNFQLKRLKISGEHSEGLLARINEIAQSIEPDVEIVPSSGKKKHVREHEHSHEHEHEHEHHHGEHCGCGHDHAHEHEHHDHEENSKLEIAVLAAGVVLFAAAIAVHRLTQFLPAAIALYAAAYLVLGINVLKATVKSLTKGNVFNENFLMTVATLGAFALGEYAEAVGVVLFFRIGEMFEDIAVSRSRKAITDVTELRVEEADVLRGGEYVRVDADDIEVGDIVRIKVGERIAVDGVVESGESRIDTSAVNGEPVPMTVRAGDSIMSGCINISETFTLRATATADDSMITKIANAVEDASSAKPKLDRFITRFAKVYTPIVIGIAAATALLGTLITGDWQKWVYSALTFLVISCPCALVLSVPLAYFSGIGASSKLGILFKGGDSIEALGKVKAIAFDKTGTLTNGSFTVTRITSAGSLSDEELLHFCGSCEQISTHPVAESIVSYCRANGIHLTEPGRSSDIAGRGVEAEVDGRTVLCGNMKLMQEKGAELTVLPQTVAGTSVYVAVDGRVEGVILVSDEMKKTSAEAVKALKSMGIATAMFTGDVPETAEEVGAALGVDTAKGGLLPDEKLSELRALREKHGSVMFVGDGLNDAPVLAGADVGGAMQTGSDLALEAADAVFISSEPMSVVTAKKIADKTLRISCENIIFALVVKAAVLVLGLVGHPNMWLAVFADSGTAMLLILNSIRALDTKKYR
ncbi:Cd2+/Zn2+-exporting ATPase [Ruminococcus sp. YRD2003]|uniref:heavy metal translocating P-type ATPase n=1 Tax=Ruminococcus sp. YRD2003 TaxID=1452313 RepID=UPI0008BD8E6E|nr:Cd2+/Zn2+-exporting ATPase [Ruminococcus flavefaciens]